MPSSSSPSSSSSTSTIHYNHHRVPRTKSLSLSYIQRTNNFFNYGDDSSHIIFHHFPFFLNWRENIIFWFVFSVILFLFFYFYSFLFWMKWCFGYSSTSQLFSSYFCSGHGSSIEYNRFAWITSILKLKLVNKYEYFDFFKFLNVF